jgi:hypothetical protein
MGGKAGRGWVRSILRKRGIIYYTVGSIKDLIKYILPRASLPPAALAAAGVILLKYPLATPFKKKKPCAA